MCLVFFAWKHHPGYHLILVSNRDEFYNRPTCAGHFWEDSDHLFAPQDRERGGTWLGLSKHHRFATLTNFRDPANIKENPPSRGLLVSDFLQGQQSPMEYLQQVASRSESYNPFSLLTGDPRQLAYFSNKENVVRDLEPGIYGLSNALLDSDWPKVQYGKSLFTDLLEETDHPDGQDLVNMMMRKQPFEDHKLPNTGVGLLREKLLSPLFIDLPNYGTRTTTVLTITTQGRVNWLESEHHEGHQQVRQYQHEFQLEGLG